MKRLKTQLKLHFWSSRFLVLLTLLIIVLSLAIEIFSLKDKVPYRNLFSVNMNTIFIYLSALSISPRYNFQYIIGMGSTRRDFFKGTLVFYILTSLLAASLLVLGFIMENILYKLYGRIYIVDFYGIIKFQEMSAVMALTLFILLFSIVLSIIGISSFIFNIITSYFNGIPVFIAAIAVIMTIIFSLSFGWLNRLVTNLFVEDFGIVLYSKLIIVGLSGILLSWPFIKNLENFEISWGRKK